MKRFKFSILFIILLLLESGCDNNDELANALLYGDRSLPSLTTKEITNITSFSATSGGIIISDGGDDVTVCGIAYGESENPTINDNKVSIEEVTSDFIVNISGLLPETMYYVRAYATNNAGTSYGDNVSFTTLSVDPDLPTVTTNNVTNITTTSATGGGNISSIGGSPVTARGLAYGTSPSPTIAGNTVSAGSGSGGFSVTMTGLNSGTTYFVRAYATNSSGTAYGDNVQFTTQSSSANLPSVTTSNITNITTTSATGGGTVTSDGGASVTARGIAYGTSPNPTTAGSTVSSGSGTGNFTANMTGLTPNSTYYVRAYATNSAGTAYGSERDFSTIDDETCEITTVTTGTTYDMQTPNQEIFTQGSSYTIVMYHSNYNFGQANNVSLFRNEQLVHNYGNWLSFSTGTNSRTFILPSGVPNSKCYTMRVIKGEDIYVSPAFRIIPN